MNNCVETAPLGGALLAVRDFKHPEGPTLLFPPEAWQPFPVRVTWPDARRLTGQVLSGRSRRSRH
ncbi:hypothetical protein GCM10020367_07870 [Streptomyces sannanensis]|uniref:DUF397 domain-containing protein n=1 Tax=Streptomyces sannanensis TaxID=285536 RepID=A0ABP6S5J7_9ACTN